MKHVIRTLAVGAACAACMAVPAYAAPADPQAPASEVHETQVQDAQLRAAPGTGLATVSTPAIASIEENTIPMDEMPYSGDGSFKLPSTGGVGVGGYMAGGAVLTAVAAAAAASKRKS